MKKSSLQSKIESFPMCLDLSLFDSALSKVDWNNLLTKFDKNLALQKGLLLSIKG